jgi:hypothetical protein
VENELPLPSPSEPALSPCTTALTQLPAIAVPALPSQPNSAVPEYEDRGTGLVIFGVIQIILGLLAGLMVPFAALGAFVSHFAPGSTMRPGQILSAMATYVALAALLLTLGIGSVQMKRWARALSLVISWYWMITGVLITILLTAALPVAMRGVLQAEHNVQAQSAGIMAVILTIIIVLAAIFLVVVPIVFVVFYSRSDVAETCRRHDPVERWTDRIPLPVLGASVVFASQALYLFSAGATAPLFPFFGHYLTGLTGFICFFVLAAVDGFLAFTFLRVKPAAWWIAVLIAPIRLGSMSITFARADLMRAYSRMGWSDEQIQMLNSSPFVRSHVILWWSLVSGMLFFAYVLWLKRYFKSPGLQQPQPTLPSNTVTVTAGAPRLE